MLGKLAESFLRRAVRSYRRNTKWRAAPGTIHNRLVEPLEPRLLLSTVGGQSTGDLAKDAIIGSYQVVDSAAKLPALLPPQAIALNHAVSLSWLPVPDPGGQFDHYAIYRSTGSFSSVVGMTPIETIDEIHDTEHPDTTALNGVGYHYAVTAVAADGGEITSVQSVGPRTPRDETDLQVVSISRAPQYPRYAANYTDYTLSEPSGFGPYHFSASTSLGDGQTFATQRFPELGDPVTYTATIRNRGTNAYSDTVAGTWRVDDAVVATPSQPVELAPGETATLVYVRDWDNQPHELSFTMDITDARPENNQLTSDTLAVPFLTYIDASFVETFREVWTPQYPQAVTDDFIDWLNRHMASFNRMFEEGGSQKRVHYDVLEVIDDNAPDPNVDRSPYAVFPFRYRYGVERDPRQTAWYRSAEDIDFGLPHEMAHQLGMIDLYRLNLGPNDNLVSGIGYSGPDGLMRFCEPFLSEHSALAMEHWLYDAHGYYGQYLYCIPETIQLHILDCHGQPLEGAVVKMYQACDRPDDGRGMVITDQVKAQGTTDADGLFTLPNVPINRSIIPPVGTGDALHDNPFGYVACIGTNAILHFRVEYDGGVDYAWLDVTEANVAHWRGQTELAVFERQLALGGEPQTRPPRDMTEMNASDWSAWSEDGSCSVQDDTANRIAGESSVHFITNGGFDNCIRYPRTFNAQWDLSQANFLNVSFYAENSEGFQNGSPWIRLKDTEGNYFQYQYFINGVHANLLDQARGVWRSYQVPLDAAADTQTGWRRTTHGSPDLADVRSLEIHADTWGYGFELWLDGVGFDLPDCEVVGRHVFYNNSAFDGDDPLPNARDDLAIAPDKSAALPGEEITFANYTSYSRGINGIMVDVLRLPKGGKLDADDFRFRVGNTSDPSGWAPGPAPTSVTVRSGEGVDGSDRVTILWPEGAIRQQWLQVTLLASDRLQLPEDDVFYFGNAIGESGNSATDAKVNAYDMLAARNHPRNFGNLAPIEFPYDYDRDAGVNATDVLIARNHQTHFLSALDLRLTRRVIELVSAGGALSYRVPLPGDAALGATWTGLDFDDTPWAGDSRPPRLRITEAGSGDPDYVEIQNVSEEAVDTSGWIVAVNNADDREHPADINLRHSTLWTLPPSLPGHEVLYRSDVNDGSGHYWGENIFWRTDGPGWVLLLDDEGDVADFVVWGYGEAEIASLDVTIHGHRVTAAGIWSGGATTPNANGNYSLQRTGGVDHDNASDWTAAALASMGVQNATLTVPFSPEVATGIGFSTHPDNFGGAIGTQVGDEMRNVNASLWTRIVFEAGDPAELDELSLRIKYNDGFVAYLNGQAIARRNAPAAPQWNSAATATRSYEDSSQLEQINVTGFLGALRAGANVLAIHGLNDSAADGEFLILPELIGTSYLAITPKMGALDRPPGRESQTVAVSWSKWAWLQEFDPTDARRRLSSKDDPVGKAVDQLLAVPWP